MTRFVPVTVLMVLLVASRVAGADGEMPTGPLATGSIAFSELKIHENNSPTLEPPKTDPDSIWHYFNLAHCLCSQNSPDTDFKEKTFAYLLTLQNVVGQVSRPLEIWVGSNCDMDAARPPSSTATCHRIDSAGLTSVDLISSPGNFRPEIPVFDMMTPTPNAMTCTPAASTNTVWAAVDTTGNSILDYFKSQTLTTDSLAPPLPTEFKATGGEGSIVVSWKQTDTSDVFAYQALCARNDGSDDPGVPNAAARPKPRYMTARDLCGRAETVNLGNGTAIPVPEDSPDAGSTVAIGEGLRTLESVYLCGETLSPTATSMTISGLTNDVPYQVVVLAIDKYQNASGTFFTSTVTPQAATDFWEDIHGNGGGPEGGLCLLAETYGEHSALTTALRAFRDDTLGGSRAGRWLTEAYYATLGRLGGLVHGSLALRVVAGALLAPVVALALAWHWLTLPGLIVALITLIGLLRLRRTARWRALRARWLVRAGAAVSLGWIALAPGSARAGGYEPYWEHDPLGEQNATLPDDDPSLVEWHAGFRLGPYVPQIDAKIGPLAAGAPGPYEQMFGDGTHWLTMLDVDRILWTGFGQLGIGGSIGYWQKTARPFVNGSKPTDMPRERVRGDRAAFKLVPMALTATYRFTWFADTYGVPVVPYARAGLAYDVWWMTTPGGDYSRVCKDPTMDFPCAAGENKALGGSLGLTGAIGLAIRAEQIDASAAMSMRQSGIQHAGIFAELSFAKVDGFGSDKKLSVGDNTYFFGVDFEF